MFRLDPDGTESVLHNFGGKTGGVFDGALPYAGLIIDAAGNLYGEASVGGSGNCGVVFKLDPSGVETALHSFTGPDGCGPRGGLSQDVAGNLYGTTEDGGANNSGVVFKLDPAGNQTVVYSFTGGTDGFRPVGGVIVDKAGNLYGVTEFGGPLQGCASGVFRGCGVAYKLDPAGQQTVLHAFRGSCPSGDGRTPEAGLLFLEGASMVQPRSAARPSTAATPVPESYSRSVRDQESRCAACRSLADSRWSHRSASARAVRPPERSHNGCDETNPAGLNILTQERYRERRNVAICCFSAGVRWS